MGLSPPYADLGANHFERLDPDGSPRRPGPGGMTLAHAAWLQVLRALGTQTWFEPRVYVSNAGKVFDADGRVVDEVTRAAVAKHLDGFSEFIARAGRAR
jgi:chromate reductase, NAD(P)H dehydrogenase (quinone)